MNKFKKFLKDNEIVVYAVGTAATLCAAILLKNAARQALTARVNPIANRQPDVVGFILRDGHHYMFDTKEDK